MMHQSGLCQAVLVQLSGSLEGVGHVPVLLLSRRHEQAHLRSLGLVSGPFGQTPLPSRITSFFPDHVL